MNRGLCLIISAAVFLWGCSSGSGIKNEPAEKIDFSIEQGGRIIDIIDDTAEIRRTKFTLTFRFSQPDSIFVNASFLSETFNNARTGLPLGELAGFRETGIAEELFNRESVLYISRTSPNFWYYSEDTDHRFNNVLKIDNSYVCSREITGLIDLDGKSDRTDIAGLKQNDIYLVIIKSEWNQDYTKMIEKCRRTVKLKFII